MVLSHLQLQRGALPRAGTGRVQAGAIVGQVVEHVVRLLRRLAALLVPCMDQYSRFRT